MDKPYEEKKCIPITPPPPKANFLKLLRTLKNKLILISQQKMNKAYN